MKKGGGVPLWVLRGFRESALIQVSNGRRNIPRRTCCRRMTVAGLNNALFDTAPGVVVHASGVK